MLLAGPTLLIGSGAHKQIKQLRGHFTPRKKDGSVMRPLAAQSSFRRADDLDHAFDPVYLRVSSNVGERFDALARWYNGSAIKET